MKRFNYAIQDIAAGQDHFDAWEDQEGPLLAESRSDVLNYITGFREPAHAILNAVTGEYVFKGFAPDVK